MCKDEMTNDIQMMKFFDDSRWNLNLSINNAQQYGILYMTAKEFSEAGVNFTVLISNWHECDTVSATSKWWKYVINLSLSSYNM